MPSTTSDPIWTVKDPGSFASIHVQLPPGSHVHCESDAVVTYSHKIRVKGVMSGGLWAALTRIFVTQESFFTTVVENMDRESEENVMMAPRCPGGIALHELSSDDDGGLMLTSGAYIASDADVKVTSEVQTKFTNSLLSGTGFFLLRAKGDGYVACGAFGAIHEYELLAGERRAVDNGHLVAWSASMKYSMGLASGPGTFFQSMSSGEGMVCHFEGPGVIYLQSHKQEIRGSAKQENSQKPIYPLVTLAFNVGFVGILLPLFLQVVLAFLKFFNPENIR